MIGLRNVAPPGAFQAVGIRAGADATGRVERDLEFERFAKAVETARIEGNEYGHDLIHALAFGRLLRIVEIRHLRSQGLKQIQKVDLRTAIANRA